MSAKILDGRKVSKEILNEIKQGVKSHELNYDATPTLALVRAGSDPASVSYAGMIERTCNKVGINFVAHTRPADVTEDEMVRLIRSLNDDDTVNGVIIQQPLPEGIRPEVARNTFEGMRHPDGGGNILVFDLFPQGFQVICMAGLKGRDQLPVKHRVVVGPLKPEPRIGIGNMSRP